MLEPLLVILLLFLFPLQGVIGWWGILAVLLLIIPGAIAMKIGAPYVPTPKRIVDRMFTLAKIRPGEKVVDLGCGDGKLVFKANALGALAEGWELSVPTYAVAKLRSLFHPRSRIRFGNFWHRSFPDADVVFCYLLPQTMQTFKNKIWPTLKPGCRVVSHAFKMEGIEPVAEDRGAILYVKHI